MLLPLARTTAERLLNEFPDWKPYLVAVPRENGQVPGDLRVRVPDPIPKRRHDLVIETHGNEQVIIGFFVADIDGLFRHKVARCKNDVLLNAVVMSLRGLLDEKWVVYAACDDAKMLTSGKLNVADLPQTSAEWKARLGARYDDAITTVRVFSWRGTYDAEIRI